jgi:3-dehydroquinate synthase
LPNAPERTIPVALGERAYDIHIAAGLLDRAGTVLRPKLTGKALIVADAQVARLYGERLVAALAAGGITAHLAPFAPGEPNKSVATAEQMWQACAAQRIDRGDAIIGFGGGISGDLAGFVAACWMRGVAFAQIPTTLLAMVDSSVGGKTGVNSAAGKNLVGAFKQPVAVLIDPTLLASMDDREYRAGLAEVLKYGVITDPAFLAWQEANATALANRETAAVAHAVGESCRLKARYVVEDEHERGVRAHLNYGHTFGHALERQTGYTRYLHGETVGIGMRMAAELSQRLGMLADPDLARRQDALLTAFGLPLRDTHLSHADLPALVTACGLDKKVSGGRMRFVLPRRVGVVETVTVSDADAVGAAFASGMGA